MKTNSNSNYFMIKSVKVVLGCKLVLVAVELGAFVDLRLNSLRQCLVVALGELLLGALHLRYVSCGIRHFLDHSLVADLLILAFHPPCVTLRLQPARVHHPLLRADRAHELVVVGDDDDTSLEFVDGARQCSKRFTVEVVGWLVEDKDVRLVPHGSSQHDLHLLPARQCLHPGVSGELCGQAAIREVLLDVGGRQRSHVQAACLGDTRIDGLDGLPPSLLLELFPGEVGGSVAGRGVPNLVQVLLGLVLATAAEELGNDLMRCGERGCGKE